MNFRTQIEDRSPNPCSYFHLADTNENAPAHLAPPKWTVSERGKRLLLALIGIGFVGLGAVGAILPGIPTVGPLLVASFCFSKSCPWLEKRLIRNRFFARFLSYLDGNEIMSLRMRLGTIATMWASIGLSLLGLYAVGQFRALPIVVLFVAGIIGTLVIARFRSASGKRTDAGA